MMIVIGIGSLVPRIYVMSGVGIRVFTINPLFYVVGSISAIFLVIGGVFCLRRQYWGICFASTLLLLLSYLLSLLYSFGVYISIGLGLPLSYFVGIQHLDWVSRFFAPFEYLLPIIFVCVTRKEWRRTRISRPEPDSLPQ